MNSYLDYVKSDQGVLVDDDTQSGLTTSSQPILTYHSHSASAQTPRSDYSTKHDLSHSNHKIAYNPNDGPHLERIALDADAHYNVLDSNRAFPFPQSGLQSNHHGIRKGEHQCSSLAIVPKISGHQIAPANYVQKTVNDQGMPSKRVRSQTTDSSLLPSGRNSTTQTRPDQYRPFNQAFSSTNTSFSEGSIFDPQDSSASRHDTSTSDGSFMSSNGSSFDINKLEGPWLAKNHGAMEDPEQRFGLAVETNPLTIPSLGAEAFNQSNAVTSNGQIRSYVESPDSISAPEQFQTFIPPLGQGTGADTMRFNSRLAKLRNLRQINHFSPSLPLEADASGFLHLPSPKISSKSLYHIQQGFENRIDQHASANPILRELLQLGSWLRPTVQSASVLLTDIAQGHLSGDGRQILSILFLAHTIIDVQPEHHQKSQLLRKFILESRLWIKAVSDPDAKSAVHRIVTLVWPLIYAKNAPDHQYHQACISQEHPRLSALASSIDPVATSSGLIMYLRESSSTRVCMQYFEWRDKSEFMHQVEAKIQLNVFADQLPNQSFYVMPSNLGTTNLNPTEASDVLQDQALLPQGRKDRRAYSDDILQRPQVSPPIHCEICGKTFNGQDNKSNRSKHLKSVHTDARFYCQWGTCQAQPNRKDNLRKHFREQHIHQVNHFICLWGSCHEDLHNEVHLRQHVHQHISDLQGTMSEDVFEVGRGRGSMAKKDW